MDTTTDTKRCTECFTTIDRRASRCPKCTSRQPDAKTMHRHVPGKVMGGVCAAIALQLGLDQTLVRVLAVASLAFTGGLVFWAYALLWVLTPYDAGDRAPIARLFDWAGNLFKADSTPYADHSATE